ncbi:TusA-related sulfurtransferase [Marinicella litoralis]|uniref:TusA-related sulfurtransferase n=2 Tax=Marinicella litoralis TaxID=644220 RepID=A0A4R6XUI8_9GAMM|nr:TusA-related sulfurtransferase [Marinicella litoralis]
MAMNKQTTHHIDATDLLCPVPLMMLKQAMQALSPAEQLTILVTDVHAELDFEIWCERFGHGLELTRVNDHSWLFTVTKGKAQ